MMEITNDLDNFGYIELSEAAELLEAYANAKQRQKLDFLGPEPKIYFDENNAEVFIQDADGNILTLDENGKLVRHKVRA